MTINGLLQLIIQSKRKAIWCMSGIDVLRPLVNALLIRLRCVSVALRWQFKRSLDNLYTCNISTASQKKSRMHACMMRQASMMYV
jgi:hypothetical protein